MKIPFLPIGFRCAGIHSGIKKDSAPDLALFYSEKAANAFGLLTTNRVKAAPVLVSQKNLAGKKSRAIVANSGCANACTGKRGLADAEKMCDLTAQSLGIEAGEVLVASTGVIGKFLPMNKIAPGIYRLASMVRASNLNQEKSALSAVQAIMTTDTVPKYAGAQFRSRGKTATVWGCAKGAGMIHPNMATMFSFLFTDAEISPASMGKILKSAVESSFNSLSVDGDTSTNDCVFFLANGASGFLIGERESEKFGVCIDQVCRSLAMQMASDGEGATKRIEVAVKGARSLRDARKVAETVATSPLVKTAVFGCDANWGRVIAAVGRAGVPVDPDKIDIFFNGLCVARRGTANRFSEKRALKILKKEIVPIEIDLNQGKFKSRYFTCDFSLDYVKINADYRT